MLCPSLRERLHCVRGDLTAETTDAIANAANAELAGGGGVDGAIHRAAGPGLMEELHRRYPEGCPTGEARVTSGHRLTAKFVIHCVGPVWNGGGEGEAELLASAYRSALDLAEVVEARSIAFPAISAGVYGYPHEEAARIALATLAAELETRPSIETVRVVLFGDELLEVFQRALDELLEEKVR